MASLIISTIVYLLAVWFIRRYLDGMDIPKGMTRSMVIFIAAAAIAWMAALAVDWVVDATSDDPVVSATALSHEPKPVWRAVTNRKKTDSQGLE